jgi:transcription antitermination factor NusG
MDNSTSEIGWYAVRVKSNREKIVAASLAHRGYESFLPLYRIRKQWSDRQMDVEIPLFSGYVFCRLDVQVRMPVLTIPGVMLFVGLGKVPIRIDETEIANLQTIASADLPAAPWPFLRAGQRVRIDRGPLRDMEGLVVKVKNRFRFVVSVTLLQRSVAVELDRELVSPVGVWAGHGAPAL